MEIVTDAFAMESTSQNIIGLPVALNSGGNWSTANNTDLVYKLLGECDELLTTNNPVAAQFAYYPNPVKDQLNIVSNKNLTKVEIYNLAGQRISEQSLNASNTSISTQQLSPGAYIFKATLENGQVETFKVWKK